MDFFFPPFKKGRSESSTHREPERAKGDSWRQVMNDPFPTGYLSRNGAPSGLPLGRGRSWSSGSGWGLEIISRNYLCVNPNHQDSGFQRGVVCLEWVQMSKWVAGLRQVEGDSTEPRESAAWQDKNKECRRCSSEVELVLSVLKGRSN